MAAPVGSISCVANVFIRHMLFERAGDIEVGHVHCFDHVSLVTAGAIEISLRGQVTRYDAPSHIFIKAEEVHELIALVDGTVVQCIHALRDGVGVGDILDPDSIPAGSTALDVSMPLVFPTQAQAQT